MPDSEQQKLAKASMMNLYWSVADFGPSLLWSAERLMERVSGVVGAELLSACAAEGRGAIILFPHMGNWEMVGPYLAARYPLTTLYKKPKIPPLDDIIRTARQRNGNVLVPADRSGVRALLKALKSSEFVAILPDQIPSKEGGEFAPFFGEPALTMTLVSNLINRTNSKAILACAVRQADGRFQINFHPADERIYSADRSTALLALNQSIEKCVLACPEQYRWEYKRYKFLPDFSRRKNY